MARVVFVAHLLEMRLSIDRTRSRRLSQVWGQGGRVSLQDLELPDLDLSREVVKHLNPGKLPPERRVPALLA
jgi:hypothetical protein